jgi:hypothetical protein
MIISTELSPEQYEKLWDKYNVPRYSESIQDRLNFWKSKIQPHHNLVYFESNKDDYAWYGTITGEDKYVNWFILNL